MRTFKVLRRGDESGVSGTGVVLEGAVFSEPSEVCVIQWITKNHPGSVTIFNTFADFKEIHIDSHPTNNTMIIWSDGETWTQENM